MKDDPFAKLGGLDQKLFTSSLSTEAAEVEKVKKIKQLPPEFGRSDVRSDVPTSVNTKERRFQRSFEPTPERRMERRPYDFYVDQVLWLNRMKVQLQETYRCRVTANSMVQLALDMLIRDYRERGVRSHIVTQLVGNQRVRGVSEFKAEEDTNEAADERPDVRPEKGNVWKR